jgi:DNA-binding NarL/FixJ family response regulator
MGALRCLIIDDHPFYRLGLVEGLGASPGFEVVGEAGSVPEALESSHAPDVVLLDLGLPGVRGWHAVEAVRSRWPQCRVLVLTASETRGDLLDVMGAGASGYLTKHAGTDELAQAIEKVAKGELFVTPRLASYLLEDDRVRTPDQFSLSRREREVLALLAEGARDREIADRLFISLSTVHSHLDRIRDKTGLRRRPELTRLAVEEGIVSGGAEHGGGRDEVQGRP